VYQRQAQQEQAQQQQQEAQAMLLRCQHSSSSSTGKRMNHSGIWPPLQLQLLEMLAAAQPYLTALATSSRPQLVAARASAVLELTVQQYLAAVAKVQLAAWDRHSRKPQLSQGQQLLLLIRVLKTCA
jgi:hypothetical protein